MKTNAKKITLAAAATALSVVMLYLGALLSVADLAAVVLSSLLSLVVLLQLGGAYPYMVYVGTSLLSFLFFFSMDPLLPLLYTAFGGIYPLLRFKIEKLPRLFRYPLRFLWFNGVAVGAYLLSLYVFMLETAEISPWLLLGGLLLANVTFFLYDVVIVRFTRFYFVRIEPRLRRLLK